MKATAYLPILCVWLTMLGCRTTSTSNPDDAGPLGDVASNQDSVAPEPDLRLEDVAPRPEVLPADTAPDLAEPVALADAAPDMSSVDRADAAPDMPAIADTAQDKGLDNGVPDSARDLTSPPVDMGSFCTGGASRMAVNGTTSNPSVTGKVLTIDGYTSAEFKIVTATFEQPIVVSWQAEKAAFSGFKTLDLANLPSGWSVRVSVGCTSMSASCSPADSYSSGLVGSLALSMGKSALYSMSICLHVEESASSPHPLVHSLDLFATHIDAD